jgi:hypothetical protein
MGLISESVVNKWHPNNKNYYVEKGYKYTKMGDEFEVKVKDLSDCCTVYVQVECDCKNCTTPIIKPIKWYHYLKCVKDDDKYYCKKCARNLYGDEKIKKTKLQKSISFEQWCIDNNKQDVLNFWDYELNNYKPNEITYGTKNNYYFKCPEGLHESELKNILYFTSGHSNIRCNKCNSFAQYLINTYGKNALELYWSNKNIINPWEIDKGCCEYVWIYCQKVNYHKDYLISCAKFYNNIRCPYCVNMKIHPLDSLGTLYPQVLEIWSYKNKKSPYEYAPKANKEVWWKCPQGIHEDFKRKVSVSNAHDFRCPECQYSKGEEKISNYFISKKYIKIQEEDYDILNNIFKEKYIYYIPQKEFKGLVGLGNGNLSYDFYLPNYNLLIEYQGQQHEKYIPGFHSSEREFQKQVEHDKRKREYAQINNINLLKIWYYDFDNIEEILKFNLEVVNCQIQLN